MTIKPKLVGGETNFVDHIHLYLYIGQLRLELVMRLFFPHNLSSQALDIAKHLRIVVKKSADQDRSLVAISRSDLKHVLEAMSNRRDALGDFIEVVAVVLGRNVFAINSVRLVGEALGSGKVQGASSPGCFCDVGTSAKTRSYQSPKRVSG